MGFVLSRYVMIKGENEANPNQHQQRHMSGGGRIGTTPVVALGVGAAAPTAAHPAQPPPPAAHSSFTTRPNGGAESPSHRVSSGSKPTGALFSATGKASITAGAAAGAASPSNAAAVGPVAFAPIAGAAAAQAGAGVGTAPLALQRGSSQSTASTTTTSMAPAPGGVPPGLVNGSGSRDSANNSAAVAATATPARARTPPLNATAAAAAASAAAAQLPPGQGALPALHGSSGLSNFEPTSIEDDDDAAARARRAAHAASIATAAAANAAAAQNAAAQAARDAKKAAASAAAPRRARAVEIEIKTPNGEPLAKDDMERIANAYLEAAEMRRDDQKRKPSGATPPPGASGAVGSSPQQQIKGSIGSGATANNKRDKAAGLKIEVGRGGGEIDAGHSPNPAAAVAAGDGKQARPRAAGDDGYYDADEKRTYERPRPQRPDNQKRIHWKRGELLGAGAYGKVYLGLNLDTGHLMAVKQVPISPPSAKDNAGNDGKGDAGPADSIVALEHELGILQNLKHDNVVQYLGTERTAASLNIFLEYVPGGSIASVVKRFGKLNERLCRTYTRQLLLGLEYLHVHQIMHRDIKGGNILVDNAGVCKLADFGAAVGISEMTANAEGHKSIHGTPYWMAPEVIKQTGHGRQADIWSVGCTVIEMASGKPPFHQFTSTVSAMFHIATTKSLPDLPDTVSNECLHFIISCLQRDPRKRPNASRLLRHPWLLGTKLPIQINTAVDTTRAKRAAQAAASASAGAQSSGSGNSVQSQGAALRAAAQVAEDDDDGRGGAQQPQKAAARKYVAQQPPLQPATINQNDSVMAAVLAAQNGQMMFQPSPSPPAGAPGSQAQLAAQGAALAAAAAAAGRTSPSPPADRRALGGGGAARPQAATAAAGPATNAAGAAPRSGRGATAAAALGGGGAFKSPVKAVAAPATAGDNFYGGLAPALSGPVPPATSTAVPQAQQPAAGVVNRPRGSSAAANGSGAAEEDDVRGFLQASQEELLSKMDDTSDFHQSIRQRVASVPGRRTTAGASAAGAAIVSGGTSGSVSGGLSGEAIDSLHVRRTADDARRAQENDRRMADAKRVKQQQWEHELAAEKLYQQQMAGSGGAGAAAPAVVASAGGLGMVANVRKQSGGDRGDSAAAAAAANAAVNGGAVANGRKRSVSTDPNRR